MGQKKKQHSSLLCCWPKDSTSYQWEGHTLPEAQDEWAPVKRALFDQSNLKAVMNGRVTGWLTSFALILHMHGDYGVGWALVSLSSSSSSQGPPSFSLSPSLDKEPNPDSAIGPIQTMINARYLFKLLGISKGIQDYSSLGHLLLWLFYLLYWLWETFLATEATYYVQKFAMLDKRRGHPLRKGLCEMINQNSKIVWWTAI